MCCDFLNKRTPHVCCWNSDLSDARCARVVSVTAPTFFKFFSAWWADSSFRPQVSCRRSQLGCKANSACQETASHESGKVKSGARERLVVPEPDTRGRGGVRRDATASGRTARGRRRGRLLRSLNQFPVDFTRCVISRFLLFACVWWKLERLRKKSPRSFGRMCEFLLLRLFWDRGIRRLTKAISPETQVFSLFTVCADCLLCSTSLFGWSERTNCHRLKIDFCRIDCSTNVRHYEITFLPPDSTTSHDAGLRFRPSCEIGNVSFRSCSHSLEISRAKRAGFPSFRFCAPHAVNWLTTFRRWASWRRQDLSPQNLSSESDTSLTSASTFKSLNATFGWKPVVGGRIRVILRSTGVENTVIILSLFWALDRLELVTIFLNASSQLHSAEFFFLSLNQR